MQMHRDAGVNFDVLCRNNNKLSPHTDASRPKFRVLQKGYRGDTPWHRLEGVAGWNAPEAAFGSSGFRLRLSG